MWDSGEIDTADYYAVIGVERHASQAAIKKAFRRRVLKVHPDHNSSSNANAEFRLLRRAHDVLSDPHRRREYDESLPQEPKRSEGRSSPPRADNDAQKTDREEARRREEEAENRRRTKERAAAEADQQAEREAARHRAEQAANQRRADQQAAAEAARQAEREAERQRAEEYEYRQRVEHEANLIIARQAAERARFVSRVRVSAVLLGCLVLNVLGFVAYRSGLLTLSALLPARTDGEPSQSVLPTAPSAIAERTAGPGSHLRLAKTPTAYAWWLRLDIVPFADAIEGIPVGDISPDWRKATVPTRADLESVLTATELEDMGDYGFASRADFDEDGIEDLALTGAYERKDSSQGLFLLILSKAAGTWSSVFLDESPQRSPSDPSGLLVVHGEKGQLRVTSCFECGGGGTVRWNRWGKEYFWLYDHSVGDMSLQLNEFMDADGLPRILMGGPVQPGMKFVRSDQSGSSEYEFPGAVPVSGSVRGRDLRFSFESEKLSRIEARFPSRAQAEVLEHLVAIGDSREREYGDGEQAIHESVQGTLPEGIARVELWKPTKARPFHVMLSETRGPDAILSISKVMRLEPNGTGPDHEPPQAVGETPSGTVERDGTPLPWASSSDSETTRDVPGAAMQKTRGVAEAPLSPTRLPIRPRTLAEDAWQRGDWKTVFILDSIAADVGQPEAQVRIGRLYYDGLGRPPDFQLAEKWYRRAAEKNSAEAKYRLALLYSDGRKGAPWDLAIALGYLGEVANSHAEAAVRLGYFFLRGVGVPQDRDAARVWYRRAADLGSTEAQDWLRANP
jgi:TPR repeat protein